MDLYFTYMTLSSGIAGISGGQKCEHLRKFGVPYDTICCQYIYVIMTYISF
jgi:hypothetical protein